MKGFWYLLVFHLDGKYRSLTKGSHSHSNEVNPQMVMNIDLWIF